MTDLEKSIQSEPAPDDTGEIQHLESDELTITAYRLDPHAMPIVPGSRLREWMEHYPTRTPYRCLPMLMANQSGWFLLNPVSFVAHWDGTMERNSSVKIVYLEKHQTRTEPIISHFGRGSITWYIPYVFRTPPGWNLLVRGPANHVKHGVFPFEGLVETDWSPMTFTMNWQITQKNQLISFQKGEPFCMIVPQRRNELEQFKTRITDYQEAPDAELMAQWGQSRSEFITEHMHDAHALDNPAWQGTYFKGLYRPDDPESEAFPDHQQKRELSAFDENWKPERRHQSRKGLNKT